MKRYFLAVLGMVVLLTSMSNVSAAAFVDMRRGGGADITICNQTMSALYLFVGESREIFDASSKLILFQREAISVTAYGTYLVCTMRKPDGSGEEKVAELTSVLDHEMWNVIYSPPLGLQFKVVPRSK